MPSQKAKELGFLNRENCFETDQNVFNNIPKKVFAYWARASEPMNNLISKPTKTQLKKYNDLISTIGTVVLVVVGAVVGETRNEV